MSSTTTATLATKSRTRQASARKQASDNAFIQVMAGNPEFQLKHYADGFTAAQLTELCKARKWGGYSGLKKEQLVEHVLSGGVAYAKGSGNRAKAKVSQLTLDVKATGVKGVSSLNAAGKKFVIANGVKPTLKDNTFTVGTVAWMQQVCRETGVKGFSGKKKDDLFMHIMNSGNDNAIAFLDHATAKKAA